MSKPVKSPKKTGNKSTAGPLMKKDRFGFTIAKDIVLLDAAIKNNPWQLGEGNWKGVIDTLNEKYDCHITTRTVRDRINLLIKKLKAQELKSRTGTEEEQSQRGSMLQEIISLQEEAAAAINPQFGADEDDIVMDDETTSSQQNQSPEEAGDVVETSAKNVRHERKQANDMRQEALDKYKNDLADTPTTGRAKKRRSLEEEAIWVKQEHEMEMEKKRFEWECKRFREEAELKRMKLEIQQEEMKRSQETALSQINMQKQMCELFNNVIQRLK